MSKIWTALAVSLLWLCFVVASFAFNAGVRTPAVPSCPHAADVIVGSGEWDAEAGLWSEYSCVSEQGFTREPKPRSGP